MGLDASVYCDCFERGRLKSAPPSGTLIVDPSGSLEHHGSLDSVEAELLWDQWRLDQACEHSGGVLMHHYLGNIALIALLRSELNRDASRFPILLGKVFYNGTHCGDFLGTDMVPALKAEVEGLAKFKYSTEKAQEYMAYFQKQMLELISASISVNKPITF
jgi:hypothetical protein